MEKAKTELVVLAEYSNYDLDGPLGRLVEQFNEYREEAARRGLTNVRLSSDWHDEPVYAYGGYDGTSERVWTISVVADKHIPAVYKTKLPKKEYDFSFDLGVNAAKNGWERKSPYNGGRADEPWFAGFDSIPLYQHRRQT